MRVGLVRLGIVGLMGILGSSVVAEATPASPPRALVQDLDARGVEPVEAAVLSRAVCEALSESVQWSVLCGEDLRAMLGFAAMSASLDACAGDACFRRVTQALEARYLVSGSLSKLDGIYVLGLTLLDGEVGEVVGRAEIKGTSLDRLHADAGEAVGILTAKLARGRR